MIERAVLARPLISLMPRMFCRPSITFPSSPRRIGAPLRIATTRLRNSVAFRSCPEACSVNDWLGPIRTPAGEFEFPWLMAACTSSMPIPRAAMAPGSSCTRTAYLDEPYTCTCATPVTVDTRWARKVSAYSLNSCRLRTSELIENIMIGESAAFALLYDGGLMPCGS